MFRVDIAKTFPGTRDAFSLRVAFETDARVLVIFGPSGSGKSLTLQCMAGMATPDRGRIEINGRELFDSSRRVDIPARRRRIGYVFQDYALFPHMTIRGNIAFGLSSAPSAGTGPARRDRVDELLERFEIGHIAHSLPGAVSGGQRQRTALARALAMEPDVLFLDEPLSALDPLLRRRVRLDLLATIERTAIPTVIISHDPDDVEAFARSLVVLEAGRVLRSLDYGSQRVRFDSAFDMLEGLLTGGRPEGEAPRTSG